MQGVWDRVLQELAQNIISRYPNVISFTRHLLESQHA